MPRIADYAIITDSKFSIQTGGISTGTSTSPWKAERISAPARF
jgi:hypothetical protein